MKIKELANLLNVSQKTIRYYEDCGFIKPATETSSISEIICRIIQRL